MNSVFDSKRLNIFIGAYGSGKSEISVNCAVGIKNRNPEAKVLLADLDIVNPFYRSADAARKLDNMDIRVISPSYANSNVDVPALSGEVYSIFDDESYVGVFDIGGEDMGANVLGSMHNRLLGIDYNLFMVINTLRPFTSDEDSIILMAKDLEAAAKLPITGFINNTDIAVKMKIRQRVGILIIIMFDVKRLVHRLFRTPLNIKELQQIWVVDVIFV